MVKIVLLDSFIYSACGTTEKSLCKVLYVKGIPGHSKGVHQNNEKRNLGLFTEEIISVFMNAKL